MPKRYPPEFRRKVLDLVAFGSRVTQFAADLDISDQTIYFWHRQERIDSVQLPGTTSADNAELVAARRRIAELEAEVAVHRRAAELFKEGSTPQDGTRRSR
ncbi:transposase [Saccharothrix sp. S26]|uniref:transposase n=1 Tax=Saccharothrix sp. S26 TaxID=2907215 RepID=UPI001F3CC671|nr:transposase [Saccharothrix sp. S26]MCE6995528.1 transposase [Saccharothrix sp. S26]